ncbi:MAG: hypothetical protein MUF55_08995 [Hydrogenophaga sp.]|nr:hypothetical protein [Hydrogenophaga sp.]
MCGCIELLLEVAQVVVAPPELAFPHSQHFAIEFDLLGGNHEHAPRLFIGGRDAQRREH